MEHIEYQYKQLLSRVLANGYSQQNRTGIDAIGLLGQVITHDMKYGFPLMTLRRLPERSMRVETEFYLRGYTDRRWLTDRGCHFWDSWRPYTDDPNDLGPTYGFAWRHWGAHYGGLSDYSGKGKDQLKEALNGLKNDPYSRQMVISQWNADYLKQQALVPCIFSFQLINHGGKLNLIFYQRSCDLCIGFPNDFAQFALILHLFAKELDLEAGKVIGMLGLAEVYQNHVEGALEMITKRTMDRGLPSVSTANFSGILNWSFKDTGFYNYNPHEKIKFDIAV